MKIHEKTIDYYINKLKTDDYFCFPGYSDAEFYSMMGIRPGNTTGLGQVLDVAHGKKLLDVMRRRQNDSRWLFAIPSCLSGLPEFTVKPIPRFLMKNGVQLDNVYERDMVLDELAKSAGLHSFIEQLQEMDTVIIGPHALREPLQFLDYKAFISIETPNLHMRTGGISRAVYEAMGYDAVYLISAGVSSPVIIDRLHKNNPNAFYIDCGSIWDAFAGIGGQRQWRADLYNNPAKLEQWKRKNIYGADYAQESR